MRRVVKVSIPIVALALFAVISPGSASVDKTRPSLRVLDDSPLRIAGRGFQARERVTLRASTGGRTATKIVFATTLGRFTVQLAVNANCSPLRLIAEGRAGSRATFRRIA